MLRSNMKMVEDSIIQPEPEEDLINWTDTVHTYDTSYNYNTLGYNVNVNITYRKEFADVYCKNLNDTDQFHLRVVGLMHAFDTCHEDIITRHIKFHKFEFASAHRNTVLPDGTVVVNKVHPTVEEFKAQLVYEMNPKGKVVPKLKPVYNYN